MNKIIKVVGLLALVVGLMLISASGVEAPQPETEQISVSDIDESETNEYQSYDTQAMQSVIDEWVARDDQSVYSIVIQDPGTARVLASHNQTQTFFSASLYKLYMAFLVWQDIEAGTIQNEQNFVAGNSTVECLDLMLRTSDSTCGEAVLALYDYQTAQTRLMQLGLPSINMPGFQTSALDMAVLLQHIYDQEWLSAESAGNMRRSMKDQIYDQGLKKGFSRLVVENKVGFSENQDWHDVGFVELTDGRYLIVSVLSRGALSAGVSGLANNLQEIF